MAIGSVYVLFLIHQKETVLQHGLVSNLKILGKVSTTSQGLGQGHISLALAALWPHQWEGRCLEKVQGRWCQVFTPWIHGPRLEPDSITNKIPVLDA